MKIPFLPDEAIDTIKSNLTYLNKNFLNPTNDWIAECFGGESPFKDTKYEIDDFELDMSQEKAFYTEAENVKRIYSRLRFLSDSQASDERLWSALCLGPFYSYVKYRWEIEKNCSVNNIEQHFFFAGPARRALTRNAIARLWWIGRLTYNDTDGYTLTDYICSHSDYISHILERNTSNNPTITRAFLHAVMDAQAKGARINTDTVADLAKYLNLLGGVYILDCLPYDTIYQKILQKAQEY